MKRLRLLGLILIFWNRFRPEESVWQLIKSDTYRTTCRQVHIRENQWNRWRNGFNWTVYLLWWFVKPTKKFGMQVFYDENRQVSF